MINRSLYKQPLHRSLYYYLGKFGLRNLALRLWNRLEKRDSTPHSPITMQRILSQNITEGYFDGGRLKLA